jgi:hypothetical protein
MRSRPNVRGVELRPGRSLIMVHLPKAVLECPEKNKPLWYLMHCYFGFSVTCS